MPFSRFLSSLVILLLLTFNNLSLAAAGTNLRLIINVDKAEINKGEISIINYELQGSERDLIGTSIQLQGRKLESNRGYEILSPDSTTIYVFQVTKNNKPVLTKSVTIYILENGKPTAPNFNNTNNAFAEKTINTAEQRTPKKEKKIRAKSIRFYADIDRNEVSKGDSAFLRYKLTGKPRHLLGTHVFLNGQKLEDERGLLIIQGDSSITLYFQVRKEDALILKKEIILNVSEQEHTPSEVITSNSKINIAKPSPQKSVDLTSNNKLEQTSSDATTHEEKVDGRFNIVGDGKYLTYSGNTQSSSSHFIIQVGDHYASNDPNLKNTTYLKAQEQLEVPFEKGSTLCEDVFYFENIRIVQRLTPLDSSLQPILKNTWGSLYKIEYELENYSFKEKTINFLTLNDFMLAQNDNPRAYINSGKLLNTWECDKSQMPESIQLRLNSANSKINARCILKHKLLNGPDSLCYGNWQFIHQATQIGNIRKQELVDNALLLKWSNIHLAGQEKRSLSYAYGFTGNGKVDIQMIDANIHFVESILYYKMGATEISSRSWKAERKTLLRLKPTLSHIELIGHTDAMGTAISNIKLSKIRCLGIKYLLVAAGVKKELISIKPMGETMADQSLLSRKKGRKEDRKVLIHYFLQSAEHP